MQAASTPSSPGRALVPISAAVPSLRARHGHADFHFRFARRPVGGARKRFVDAIIASLALVLLSPLLIVVALLISLDSPGPILFRQRRSGFRGKAFKVLKFRTMTCLENGALGQATRNDRRVTKIGKFLRRSSIDELPQLINVLRGEMSLVGPRPHALFHDAEFWRVNSDYPRRFVARPGITGYAQISGHRGQTETPEKVEARLQRDLDY